MAFFLTRFIFMKTITQEQLNELIISHNDWLNDPAYGERLILENIDLSNLNFSNCNLDSCFISSCDLTSTDFTNCNLSFADIMFCNSEYAIFDNVDLSFANLVDFYMNSETENVCIKYASVTTSNIKTICSGDTVITIFNNQVAIDDVQMSYEEWITLTDKELHELFIKFKPVIKLLINI